MATDFLAFQMKYRYQQQVIPNQEHRSILRMRRFLVCAILLGKKLKLNLDCLSTGNGTKVDISLIYTETSEDVIGTDMHCMQMENQYFHR